MEETWGWHWVLVHEMGQPERNFGVESSPATVQDPGAGSGRGVAGTWERRSGPANLSVEWEPPVGQRVLGEQSGWMPRNTASRLSFKFGSVTWAGHLISVRLVSLCVKWGYRVVKNEVTREGLVPRSAG